MIEKSSGTFREKRNNGRIGRTAGISEEELSIFGLTDVEVKIVLGLLELGSTPVSRLAREIGLAHTTVHSAIRRLRAQGLVRRVSRGRASVWKAVRAERIRRRLERALAPFEAGLSRVEIEEELGVRISAKAEFSVFQGIPAMLKVYHWFFLNHRNERVYGILTTSSQETIFKKFPAGIVIAVNNLVKQHHIIMDAVLPESILNSYRRHLSRNRHLAASVGGRTTSVHLIPDEYLAPNADLIIGRDIVALANWEEEALILIKNPDMVTLLRSLFEFTRDTGKSFDQNAFIRSLIEKQGDA